MYADPTTKVTHHTRQQWCDTGEALNKVNLVLAQVREGDQTLHKTIWNYGEQPTANELKTQTQHALNLISAAQAYYYQMRDLHRGASDPSPEREP